MNKKILDIIDFPEEDYEPLVDYGAWRVAVLRACVNTRPEMIATMQKHLCTDEVFCLLDGHCTLLLSGNAESPNEVDMIEMMPHKLYNIKKGTWHNHVMDEHGEVLIIENRDTTDENSPICKLTANQTAMIEKLQVYRRLRDITGETRRRKRIMGKTRKKVTAVAIMLGMVTAMCACAGTSTDNQTVTEVDAGEMSTDQAGEPGWKRDADEKIALDWYVNYSWFTTPWGENLVSKSITEQTGVDINFITPMGNETEKLNALIASDSLPDIITIGWWEPQVMEMIDGDMIYALNELADEYDPYFWKVTDEDVVNWYTQKDGNIYGYPNSAYTPKDLEEHDNIGSNQTFLVRKDIYEAIGSPDMTTQEGFEVAVKKAAEMFPEIDGQPLIPVGAHVFEENGCVSFDQYLADFLAVPYEKDGEIYDRYTDSEYLSWLKMFRRLGEEGYLANDIFVDQRTQMEEKLAQGRYFCMLYQRTDVAAQQKTLYEKDPNSIYMAVDGPKNLSGDDPELPTTDINGWTVTMISKNCKNPKRAIEFINYMMSEEGQMMIYLGVEGETYDMVDGVATLKPEVEQLLNTNRDRFDQIYGADDAYWMLQNNVMQLKWKQPLTEPIGQLEEWTYPYTHYFGQYDSQIFEDSEINQIKTKCEALWGKMLPRLLLASSDEEFDEMMEEYKNKRTALGYDKVQAERTRLMEESKKKLGLE